MKKLLVVIVTLCVFQIVYSQSNDTIIYENFENSSTYVFNGNTDTLSSGWIRSQLTDSAGWTFGSSVQLTSLAYVIPTHTRFASSQDDINNQNRRKDYLIMPMVDLSSTNAVLSFDALYTGVAGSKATVEISTNNGQTWSIISTLSGSTSWQSICLGLENYVGNDSVLIGFHHDDSRIDGNDTLNLFATGFSIDNVLLVKPDLGITAINTPISAMNLTNSENVSVQIKNYSSGPIKNFSVGYSIDGVTAQQTVTENISNLIVSGGTYNYTFTEKAELLHKGIYKIKVWTSIIYDNDCDNDTLTKTVYSYPSILGTDTTICAGSTLTLNTSSDFVQYKWTGGSTNSSLNVSSTGTYSVTVTNVNNDSLTDNIVVTVANKSLNLGQDVSICTGDSINLNAGTGFDIYTWSTGDSTQSIYVDITDDYNVTAYYDLANGYTCQLKDTINITVNSVLNVNLGSDKSICDGNSVILDAGAFDEYLWLSDSSTNQTLTVDSTGTFIVQVSDDFGCTGTDTIDVTLNSLPNVDLGNDTSVCYGETIVLDAGAGVSSYLWNNAATSQTINVTTTGTYSVTVTDINSCTNSDLIHISVNNSIINLGNDISICDGDSILLDVGSGYNSYLWSTTDTTQAIYAKISDTYYITAIDSLGNGLACQFTDTIEVTVDSILHVNLGSDKSICEDGSIILDAGSYDEYLWLSDSSTSQTLIAEEAGTYIVEVSNVSGCTGTDTIEITENSLPTVSLGANDVICEDSSLILDAGVGVVSYLWSNAATTQTITVTSAGTYSVTVTDINSCTNSDVVVISNPTTLDLGPDITICDGDTTILETNESFATYLWSNSSTSQTTAVDDAGTYYINVTTLDGGCPLSDTVDVIVYSLPLVNLGSDTAICKDDSYATLNAGGNYASYLWTVGTTTKTYKVYTTGTYGVEVTTTNGCKKYDEVHITINQLPTVKVTSSDTLLCEALFDTVTLIPTVSEDITTYSWIRSGIVRSTDSVYKVDTTGIYYLVVTNSNGCSYSDTISFYHYCVGIDEFSFDNSDISCYPNPNKGAFTISISNLKDAIDLSIINMEGQIVYSEKLNANIVNYNKEIDIKDYSTGMYYLRVTTNKNTYVNKIVVY